MRFAARRLPLGRDFTLSIEVGTVTLRPFLEASVEAFDEAVAVIVRRRGRRRMATIR